MSESFREKLIEKNKKVKDKYNSCREKFVKKEEGMRADLEEARSTWRETGEKFRWWQTLP